MERISLKENHATSARNQKPKVQKSSQWLNKNKFNNLQHLQLLSQLQSSIKSSLQLVLLSFCHHRCRLSINTKTNMQLISSNFNSNISKCRDMTKLKCFPLSIFLNLQLSYNMSYLLQAWWWKEELLEIAMKQW